MSKFIRRVSLGTDFPNSIKRAAYGKSCPCCGAESVEEVDHALALQFGGDSTESNALGLCKSCHGYKNYLEKGITSMKVAKAHAAQWLALKESPAIVNGNLWKRIQRAKRQKNQALVERLRKEKTRKINGLP